jgi:hypothetical protein
MNGPHRPPIRANLLQDSALNAARRRWRFLDPTPFRLEPAGDSNPGVPRAQPQKPSQETCMIRFTTIDTPAAAADSTAARIRAVALRWDKLSAADVEALSSRDDLIGIVASRYGVAKTQARKDVDAALRATGP